MNDEQLKSFLQKNANPAPEAPLGEASDIWNAIQSKDRRRKIWWGGAPALAASIAVIVFFQFQSHRTEVKVEEEYLQHEWALMMDEVDAVEPELVTFSGR